jgi:hypothetical protein
MRNEYILNSKLFLFAGAGASQPFDKWLMKEFIDHLITEIHSHTVPPKGLHGLLDAIIHYRGKDLEDILKEINDITDKNDYLGDMTRRNYIHDILEGDPERSQQALAVLGSGAPPAIRSSSISRHYSDLVKRCNGLRNVIEKMIYDHYGVLSREKIVEVYDPLVNTLTQFVGEDKLLPIFTTNYDCCFEEFVKEVDFELVDGFSPTHGGRELIWKEDTFDILRLDMAKRYLILFKLHGSVTWYDDDGVIKYLSASIHRPSNERIKNVLIYPAKNKIALDEPFFTAYDYFQRCLDHSASGVFIGYSFRDYDTVTKVKSALKFNNKLRLVILSPNADEIAQQFHPDFSGRVAPLSYEFGRKDQQESYLREIREFLGQKEADHEKQSDYGSAESEKTDSKMR